MYMLYKLQKTKNRKIESEKAPSASLHVKGDGCGRHFDKKQRKKKGVDGAKIVAHLSAVN